MKAQGLLFTAPVIDSACVWILRVRLRFFPLPPNLPFSSGGDILDTGGAMETRVGWLERADNSASAEYHMIMLSCKMEAKTNNTKNEKTEVTPDIQNNAD